MSATTDKLSILIEVLTGQAEATLGRFEKVATKAFGGADSAANKMRVSLNQRLSGGIEGLTQKVPAAKAGLDALGLSAETAASALTGGLAIGAGAAIAKGVAQSISSFEDLTGKVLQFSRVTKMSAQDSSRWVTVLADLGIAQDKAGISIGRFERNLAENVKLLDQWGVTVVRAADGTVDMQATLLKVADVMSHIQNATDQADLGVAAFGKSWQTLLPALAQGSDGLKSLLAAVPNGDIFGSSSLQTGQDLRVAIAQIKDELHGLSLTFAKDFAPAIADWAQGMVVIGHAADKLTSKLGGVAGIVNFVAKSSIIGFFSEFASKSKGAADAVDEADASVKKLGAGMDSTSKKLLSFGGFIDTFAKDVRTGVTDVLNNAAKSATDMASAQQTLRKAQQDSVSAVNDYHRAQKDLTDAQANQSVLLADEQKANLKVVDAVKAVQRAKEDAARSEAESQRNVIRAQDEVNRAAEKGDIQGYADAQLSLADAQDRAATTQADNGRKVEDANRAIGDAQQGVRDAAKAYVDSGQTITDAQQRIQAALDATNDKAIALARAIQAYDDAQAHGSADAVTSIDDQRTALEGLAATYSVQFGPDSAPVKYVQGLIALLDQAKIAAQGAATFLNPAAPGAAVGGVPPGGWGGRGATDYAPAPGMPGYNPAAGGTSVSGRMFTGSLPPAIVQHIYGISPEVAMAEAAARIRPAVSMSNVR